ncbi:hypothetical protein MSTO_24440 [Mycobacterium stomatepiae]|uniref:Uncharacterized protein n=1 Tax=Mycobacterium stomatepiae TaxID=470076 RepID=A0A7I7Q7I0_9MYCO|nr:hypothetical protein MSTO_24440 [Mycobacterium stomatepiae]
MPRVVNRFCFKYSPDVVAVGECISKWAQEDNADAFAGDVTCSAGTECPAPAVGGQKSAFGELKVFGGMGGEVDAAGQCHVTVAGGERVGGQAYCCQGRRAGSVDGE